MGPEQWPAHGRLKLVPTDYPLDAVGVAVGVSAT